MKYTNLTNDKVSLLGFGAMRFPTDKKGEILFDETKKMIEKAFSKGVNYFDTAYP